MVRGAGSGKTPERVVTLLKAAVQGSSQSAVARATGVSLSKINRYLKGIGEPQTETLQQLADFFNVTVPYLRGESNSIRTRELVDNSEVPGVIEEITQWIEEDEERRNWSLKQKEEVVWGLTLVEQVLEDEEIAQYAIEYMQRRMRLLKSIDEQTENAPIIQKELKAAIKKATEKAAQENWTKKELNFVKALLRKHCDSLVSGLTLQISRSGISFSNQPTVPVPPPKQPE